MTVTVQYDTVWYSTVKLGKLEGNAAQNGIVYYSKGRAIQLV